MSRYVGDINFTPITTIYPASKYWGITQDVSYGSGTKLLSGSAGVVDMGTTLLLIAADAFQAYQQATGATLDDWLAYVHEEPIREPAVHVFHHWYVFCLGPVCSEYRSERGLDRQYAVRTCGECADLAALPQLHAWARGGQDLWYHRRHRHPKRFGPRLHQCALFLFHHIYLSEMRGVVG